MGNSCNENNGVFVVDYAQINQSHFHTMQNEHRSGPLIRKNELTVQLIASDDRPKTHEQIFDNLYN